MNFLSLFFRGPEQLVPLAAALVVWIGLAGLGYLATGRDRVVEANAFCGWAIVIALFTVVGVLLPGLFLVLSILCGAGALTGVVLALRRGDALFLAGSWRIIVLALPVLLIAGAMEASQWDEFSNWLPPVRFLLSSDGFPTPEHGFTGYLGYPYAWPILQYLAGRLVGHQLENVGSMFNVIMLLSLAGRALRTALVVAGRATEGPVSWRFATVVVLAASAFNPTFVPKLVLTAYSDVSTLTLTGISILLAYEWLERLERRSTRNSRDVAWQLGLALALLIDIRQPNLLVAAVLGASIGYIAWRGGKAGFTQFMRDAVWIALPVVVVYFAWRGYVWTVLATVAGVEESYKPLAQWNFAVIPAILVAMLKVAWQKIAFFVPMAFCVAVGLRALIRPNSGVDRLAIMCGSIFAAYTAFLFSTYLGVFDAHRATTAVSYWRYNIDVGGAVIIVLTLAGAILWARYPALERSGRRLGGTALLLAVLLPILFVTKLRFDREPPKPFYNAVARDIAALPLGPGNLYVADPTGTGEAAVITRYRTGKPGMPYISAFSPAASSGSFVKQLKPGDYLLIHSLVSDLPTVLDAALDDNNSYLFQRDTQGWHELRRWTKPAPLSVH